MSEHTPIKYNGISVGGNQNTENWIGCDKTKVDKMSEHTPKCPECKTNEFMEYTGEDRPSESGELYDVKVYKCHKCNEEFDEDNLEEN